MSLQNELNLEAPFEDRFHEAVVSIVRTGSILTNAAEPLFRQFDLTEAQFNVLFSLKYNPHHVTQSDLGRRLVVTRASVTSVLDRLEAKRLVAREDVPGNRRIHHVVLTDEGKALIEEVEPLYRDRVRAVMSGLSDRECRTLIELLDRVRAHVGAQSELAVS